MVQVDHEAIERQPFEVSITSDGSHRVITVGGEVDLLSLEPIRQWVDELNGELAEGKIVIDISGVEFLDVVGYHGLVKMVEPSSLNGGHAVVFRPRNQVARLFGLLVEAGYQPPFEIDYDRG